MSVTTGQPAPDTNQAGTDGGNGNPPASEQKPAEQGGAASAAAGSAPKADEQKPEGSNDPAANAPAEQKPDVPEKYDLKLPDGSLLDASAVEKISSFAKERGLSNEQAQAVLERENEALASYVEGQEKQLDEKVKGWEAELPRDPEVGGEAYKQNVELAHRVVKRFFPESLQKTLAETGLGSHPDLVRGLLRIGKAMAEDQLVIPGSQSGGKRAVEDIFYSNSNQTNS